MINVQENKQKFIQILKDNCSNRFDIDEIIKKLEETDFFIAPASTKYHLSERGGLVQHSLNVYETLSNLCELYHEDYNKHDSIAIVALFHDLCKANFYKESSKNVKTTFGWTTEQCYVVDDQFPLGHGEKSVIMTQRLFSLTDEEIIAIRWHMNGFDSAVKGGDYSLASAASGKYAKLLTLLQCADMISSQILEI